MIVSVQLAAVDIGETSRLEDCRLEDRAAALINPQSGLANDYLNIFNEIVMLLELLPEAPSLAEDIAQWRPVSYAEYFARSALPDRHRVLTAYEQLDPAVRALFDRTSRDLARMTRALCATVSDIAHRDPANSALLSRACAEAARSIHGTLERLAYIVNSGREGVGHDMQAMADRIFAA
jgi:hypothetical protein